MELDVEREGMWDLVVLAETAYYLGWLYPMFEIGWLAHSLHEATRSGGRLLLANTISHDDGIMSPWLIRSYADIFSHVGYEVERGGDPAWHQGHGGIRGADHAVQEARRAFGRLGREVALG